MNYLHFSKESYAALTKARDLAGGNSIKPKHILLGLFLTKNLLSNILNITKSCLINATNIKTSYQIFNFSKDSLYILSNLLLKHKIINTIDIFSELLNINNFYIKYIFKNIPIINLYLYNKLISQSNLNYINNFCYWIKFKRKVIINRSSEIITVSDVIERNTKNNFVVVGTSGIGRFSIIQGVFNEMIITKSQVCTKKFYVFDLSRFFTSVYGDTLTNHIQKINNWIFTTFKLLLILPYLESIDDIDLISPLLNHIFLLVKQKQLQIIITTTVPQFSTLITSKNSLNNIYESLVVKELTKIDTSLILKNIIPNLEHFFTIKISYNIIKIIIETSKLTYPNKVFPIKAIELLEIICTKFTKMYPTVSMLTLFYFNKIISSMSTNISTMTFTETNSIKNFKFLIKKRIFGQTFIINKINNTLLKTVSGFKIGNKPIGSWLLCGPSGTGKTELAKGITEVLFGNENKMIRFDMSEFMEKHSISKLIGSPPGYVGYGDKGLLTEAVLRQSNCLLLFDEIEKAHPDILNIMLQILDDGRLTDSTGTVVNFSNTLIIFTSNLGCPKNISEFQKKFSYNSINYKIDEQLIMNSIKQYFRPELLNRIQDILIFQPLEFKVLLLILNKFIKQFIIQLKLQKFPIKLLIHENLKKYLVKLSISPLYGARPLKRIFEEIIVEPTVNILLKTNITYSHLLTYTLDNNNNISYNITPNL